MDTYKSHPIFFAVCLQILKKVMECNQNLFNYLFADAGTLLGLVRYGEYGIMPWDDDIDLGFIGNNEMIVNLIKNCLNNDLTIYAYFEKNNEINGQHMTNIFLDNNDISDLIFLNVSIKEDIYVKILKDTDINVNELEYYENGNHKIPWVDIFPYRQTNKYIHPLTYKYMHFFGASTRQREESYTGLNYNGFIIDSIHGCPINIPADAYDYLLDLFGDDIYEEIEIYGSHLKSLPNKIKILNDDIVKKYVEEYNQKITTYVIEI